MGLERSEMESNGAPEHARRVKHAFLTIYSSNLTHVMVLKRVLCYSMDLWCAPMYVVHPFGPS
jgi:hypothetical protein